MSLLITPGLVIVQGQLESLAPVLELRITSIDPTLVQATNAAAALTIRTPDGSGQVVEPAVECIPAGWNGHKYWALITGYTNGSDQTENPAIYYSDDGIAFTPVPGAPFPLMGTPANGNNDDPELSLGPDGNLHGFWSARNIVTHATWVYWTFSSDGVSWATPVAIYTGNYSVEAPTGFSMVWDGANNQWLFIYTDAANVYNANGQQTTLKRRTIAGISPGGTMSAAKLCSLFNISSTRQIWETHVARRGAQMHMVTTFADKNTGGAHADLHFGTSDDNGLTWTFNPTALLSASPSGWDNGNIYRADLVPLDDASAGLYQLWYSAKSSGNVWHMGRTKITLPRTASLSGVVVSGTPSAGQVLTATSSSSADWQSSSAAAGLPSLVQVDPRLAKGDAVSKTGTWAIATDSNNNAIYLFNSTAAQNDAIGFPVLLAAGTWTLTLLVVTANNAGILTAQIDGSSVGTLDAYASSTSPGVVLTLAGISVATSTVHALKLLIATKNASSSGYRANVAAIQLRKTA